MLFFLFTSFTHFCRMSEGGGATPPPPPPPPPPITFEPGKVYPNKTMYHWKDNL